MPDPRSRVERGHGPRHVPRRGRAPTRSTRCTTRTARSTTAALRYDGLVRDAPPLELVHLGLGPDGHTASLFPGSAALDETEPLRGVQRRRPPPAPAPDVHVPGARPRRGSSSSPSPERRSTRRSQRIRDGEDLPAGRVDADEVRVARGRSRLRAPPSLSTMRRESPRREKRGSRSARARSTSSSPRPLACGTPGTAPGHLLPEGLHPAHDAVSRPLRLLHVRQAARPARPPLSRRSTTCWPSRATVPRRVPRGAVHARRGPRGALPGGRRVARRARVRVHRRLRRTPPRARCSRRRACSPTRTPARCPAPSSSGSARSARRQGMMIETLAARLGEPGGPAPRRARQDARAAPRHPRRRRRGARPVHHRDPRRHRRDPRRADRRAARDPREPRPPRSRAGGHRPELPAQARHRDAPRPRRATRRVPLDDRRRPPRARPDDAPPGAAEPQRRPRRARSPPASTTGAASRPSPPTT